MIPTSVLRVIETLQNNGHEAYTVGGCVRDSLRGETPKDWDVATSAAPEEVTSLFQRVIPTGIKHGTVTVLSGEEKVEVTTFRADGDYSDGRRPDSVQFVNSIVEDLARRDFTINAMAFDPISDEIIDPFGGKFDLERKLIRCVGNPVSRFNEDGLRLLRCIRFACRFDFKIDAATWDALNQCRGKLGSVSIERIRDEFCKMVDSQGFPHGLWCLEDRELLHSFLPELVCHPRCTVAAPGLTVRLAGLLLSQPHPAEIMRRMKFSAAEIDEVNTMIVGWWHARRVSGPVSLRRFISTVGKENIPKVCLFADAMRMLNLRMECNKVFLSGAPVALQDLAVNGHDVMAAGFTGKAIGAVMFQLLDLVLEEPNRNTRPALLYAMESIKNGNV